MSSQGRQQVGRSPILRSTGEETEVVGEVQPVIGHREGLLVITRSDTNHAGPEVLGKAPPPLQIKQFYTEQERKEQL